MTELSTLLANEQAGVWVLGSFLILCFGAIVGLYTWMESKMEIMEKKFVTKEVCQQVHKTSEVMFKNISDSQKSMCKKIDKLIDHLIGTTDEDEK